VPRPTLKERILDAVVPAVCRWLVCLMRRLEESTTDPGARWELLRRELERQGRGR
jgi:hypothetical protein